MSATLPPAPRAAALLEELTQRGVLLHANGDRLEYDAPAGAIGDLLPEVARFKFDLIALLESPDDAPAHRWRDESPDVPSDGNAPAAQAPDVAQRDESAAALLARYRRAGAVLTLETVTHDGAQKLALGVELTARVAPEKQARAFQRITNHGLELVRALELESAPITDGGEAMLTPQTWPPTKTEETT